MIQQLAARFGEPRVPPHGRYVRFNCPFCHLALGQQHVHGTRDVHQCLFISTDPSAPSKGFGCVRCEIRGPLERLAKLLNLDSTVPVGHVDLGEAIRCFLAGNRPLRQSPVHPLPPSAPMPRGSEAWWYLVRQRGISPEEIEEYGIRLGTGKYIWKRGERQWEVSVKGRIVFPNQAAAEQVTYWVARLYREGWNGPKFVNPPDAKDLNVFFLDRAPKNQIVIVEAVISAIIGGPDCVATLGKDVSDDQLSALLAHQADQYVIALDGDARKQSWGLARRLYGWGAPVAVATLPPEHDPASLGREAFRRCVDTAVRYSPLQELRMAV